MADQKRFPADYDPLGRLVNDGDKLLIASSETGEQFYIDVDKLLELVVRSTGNEDIDGIKEFLQSPLVPDPTSDQAATSKKYVDKLIKDNYADLIPFILDGSVVGQFNTEVTYRVDIVSTDGIVFKNDDIRTTLIAIVYRGITDVTSQIDANYFRWKRKSTDTQADELWNQAHFGGTKTIEVFNTDVYQRATFSCEVTLV